MTVKIIIADDEEPARNLLRHYLSRHADMQIYAECSNGLDVLKHLNQSLPDLLFLDVQMPKLTGFEVLEVADNRPPVIFTTAYSQYAIKAFEMNAVDYLLKPYTEQRLDEALERFRQRKNSFTQPNVNKLIDDYRTLAGNNNDRIVIKSGSRINIVSVEQIHYIEAHDDYVIIYTHEGDFIKETTMKDLERGFNPRQFVRVHRSYILNIAFVSQIQPYGKDSFVAVTAKNAKVPVSKSGYKLLKTVLQF